MTRDLRPAGGKPDYLPGFGRHALLPLYDLVQRLLGIPHWHAALLDHAEPPPGARVLELGSGTGNLALMLAGRRPDLDVVGCDPDQRALDRARRKAGSGSRVRFDTAYGQHLPYADGSFHNVLSAFMYHHLDDPVKTATLQEVRRVLQDDGALHLVDFGGRIETDRGWRARMQRRVPRLRQNLGDAVPARMVAAGFSVAEEVAHGSSLVGRITIYRALTVGKRQT